MSRSKYNSTFRKELKRLNPQQTKAVQTIEGPVLVLAGPGTGKTHILTARIGRILLETDTQEHNILCLTFTDAGVHAMRQRLLQFIGPAAHRVHIYTFHSFCNTVIQENLEFFGYHDLEPMSELERIEIIRELLDGLEATHLLRARKDRHYYEKHLFDLFRKMKTENWSVEFITTQIESYLESLEHREEFKYQRKTGDALKGDLKEEKIKEQTRRMKLLQSAAELFPLYEETKIKHRRYDFDDMILWVLQAFQENENLLRNYQEQYLYFLVDEFQDTNGAQNQILQKLVEYWESPNLFVVGDDDQSIYEFQGARLKNIIEYYNTYEEHISLVLLEDNYRSSQNILDTSKAIIDQNKSRVINNLKDKGLSKILTAQNKVVAESYIKPYIVQYPNRTHEDIDIVDQIERLHQKKFPLNEIAIIYARHKQAQEIITLLEKKKIPYNTKRRVNILDQPLIQNLRLILKYLYQETAYPHSGEEYLFRLLHFDFVDLEMGDLGVLSQYMSKNRFALGLKWRTILNDNKFLSSFVLKDKNALLKVGAVLKQLISDYHNYSLRSYLERVINLSGLLSHLSKQDNKVWLIQILTTFFDFVKNETAKNPRLTVKGLLKILDTMDENRLSIGVQKSINADNGVNLVTAHSSKGLEFQYVFILDAVKDSWEPNNRGNNRNFKYPDTLTLSGEEDALEAKRRLFYVAMTRAKEYLHISFSAKDAKNKPIEYTQFLDEIIDETDLEVQQKQLPENLLVEAQIMALMQIDTPQLQAPSKDTLNALLEGFVMSISSLNQYLNCPLSFYYENILKVPSTASEAASYGTAFHYALKRLFDKQTEDELKQFPTSEEFLKDFERELTRQKPNFSKASYEHRLEDGRRDLPNYYADRRPHWVKNNLVEYDIRNIEVEGVPLKGSLDKVEILDKNTAHIVDYKTGKHNNRNMFRPTEKNPIGGLYWRQLVFYKILLENFRNLPYKAVSAEIDYLEPDINREFPRKKLKYNKKDVQIMRTLIKETYQKIQKHEFFEGCGGKRCKWCNFTKRNKLVDSLRDEQKEALDD